MALTKDRIIDSIYNQCGHSRQRSIKLVESLIEIIKSALESGEDVLITGFGKFCVREKNERKGRNPQTGEDLILEARRIVSFRCSEILRKKINSRGKH